MNTTRGIRDPRELKGATQVIRTPQEDNMRLIALIIVGVIFCRFFEQYTPFFTETNTFQTKEQHAQNACAPWAQKHVGCDTSSESAIPQ